MGPYEKIAFLPPDPLAGAATKIKTLTCPAGRFWSFFSTKIYKDHINMFLSKLGYSELVQRLFEKMTFFLVDPLAPGLCWDNELGGRSLVSAIVSPALTTTTTTC